MLKVAAPGRLLHQQLCESSHPCRNSAGQTLRPIADDGHGGRKTLTSRGTDAIEYPGFNQRITKAYQGLGRWWHTTLSSVVRRQRPKVSEFQASLDSIMASAGTGSSRALQEHSEHPLVHASTADSQTVTRTQICELLLLGRENSSATQAGCMKSLPQTEPVTGSSTEGKQGGKLQGTMWKTEYSHYMEPLRASVPSGVADSKH